MFCVFCTGHFVMVPINLTVHIVYNIFSLNISFIYIGMINLEYAIAF